jgi:uncharacterized protein with FMN-binding domain
MITNSALRTGTALVGIAGALVLAGCSGSTEAATDDTSSSDSSSGSSGSTSSDATTSGSYADGTYSAEGSYQTPETVETISVTLTLSGGVVTEVEVTGDPQARETEQYQGQFIAGISDEVVGQNIDELSVDRVAGSSLTSGGFNQAVDEIKAQAAE